MNSSTNYASFTFGTKTDKKNVTVNVPILDGKFNRYVVDKACFEFMKQSSEKYNDCDQYGKNIEVYDYIK